MPKGGSGRGRPASRPFEDVPEGLRFPAADAEIERVGDTAVLKPADRLDLIGYMEFEERLYALAESGATRIVLDLSEATALSSSCLAVLMRFWADLHAHGGCLAIARPTERVLRCIRVSRIEEIVTLYPSREAALAAVRPVRAAAAVEG